MKRAAEEPAATAVANVDSDGKRWTATALDMSEENE